MRLDRLHTRREHPCVRTPLLAVLLLLTLSTPGCVEEDCPDCAPCPPRAGVLTIRDSVTSGPVPGAAVTGGGVTWTCAESAGATQCGTFPEELPDAAVGVTVAAPGYVSKAVQLTPVGGAPDRCACGGCVSYTPSAVALVPVP